MEIWRRLGDFDRTVGRRFGYGEVGLVEIGNFEVVICEESILMAAKRGKGEDLEI